MKWQYEEQQEETMSQQTVSTPVVRDLTRRWARLARGIEQLLIAGAWRWPGAEQAQLRRRLQTMRRLQADPAWDEALRHLDTLRQGDRTAAAALLACTLTLVRRLRFAGAAVPPPRAQAQRLSAAAWPQGRLPVRSAAGTAVTAVTTVLVGPQRPRPEPPPMAALGGGLPGRCF